MVADITEVELERSAYDVWHDRAVFHFLTSPSDRVAYVRQVAYTVKRGGHVIVSTFGRRVGRRNFTSSRSQIPDVMLSHHPARAVPERPAPFVQV